MSWYPALIDVRQAYFRAFAAEDSADWHLAVQNYLFCLEKSLEAADRRAVKFFAAKLCLAYGQMQMMDKAEYYRRLC
ncbi:MAG: hypothetical protein M3511_14350 [Deinococcota bacterium]|nr:hypothetical protein [Deinococcota bacterium]